MTRTTHPIDHAIVAFLFLVEGVCWIINELAGFHAEPEVEDPRDTIAIEAPVPFDATDDLLDVTFDGLSHDFEDFTSYTVKELRKAAKGLAKGVHLMRKDELLTLLAV